MFTAGIFLGLLTYVSFLLTFRKLPAIIRRYMLRHHLVADVLGSGATFFFLSNLSHSITSVVASVIVGLLIDISLYLYEKAHPEEAVE